MNPTTFGLLATAGLFLGMLVLLETGRRIGSRRLAEDPGGARQGFGVVEGAVFSLLGLLMAFTFAGAVTRFEGRRGATIVTGRNLELSRTGAMNSNRNVLVNREICEQRERKHLNFNRQVRRGRERIF